MAHLKSYLAEKYMSGPKAEAILARVAPSKRKKRNNPPSVSGAVILDDDAGWGIEEKNNADDLADAVIASDRMFKKRKVTPTKEGSGWTTVREGIKEETPPPAADEQPVIVEDSSLPFVGGLVAASQLKKVLPKNQASMTTTADEIALAQETVYRDATGKRIDTKAERAEAARLKREREEKEAQKMEWGKGLVQKEEQEKKRLELERQKGKAFRRADDMDLNEEQKAKELWNDPAAAFLTVSPKHQEIRVIVIKASLYPTEKDKQRTSQTGIQRTTTST
jgi:pre-mRNA-splicing factor CWC26